MIEYVFLFVHNIDSEKLAQHFKLINCAVIKLNNQTKLSKVTFHSCFKELTPSTILNKKNFEDVQQL